MSNGIMVLLWLCTIGIAKGLLIGVFLLLAERLGVSAKCGMRLRQ